MDVPVIAHKSYDHVVVGCGIQCDISSGLECPSGLVPGHLAPGSCVCIPI